MMDRVGGFGDFLLLLADARAFDDVLIVMEAESEAARMREMLRSLQP